MQAPVSTISSAVSNFTWSITSLKNVGRFLLWETLFWLAYVRQSMSSLCPLCPVYSYITLCSVYIRRSNKIAYCSSQESILQGMSSQTKPTPLCIRDTLKRESPQRPRWKSPTCKFERISDKNLTPITDNQANKSSWKLYAIIAAKDLILLDPSLTKTVSYSAMRKTFLVDEESISKIVQTNGSQLSWALAHFKRLSTLVVPRSSIKIPIFVFNGFPSVILFAMFNNKKKRKQKNKCNHSQFTLN